METKTLDHRTINAVLEALNTPIRNATEACAIVRILAETHGLQRRDDENLSDGEYRRNEDRGPLVSHAIKAIQDLEDWCHVNEANWSGWGEMIVPEGAKRWTKQAKLAQDLLRDNVAPAP
ncbi:hypothetical protein K7A42_03230 [Agrobacterium sp. InxBP2]|uniref:hypothetical protein n=1 Tax=Agrobacterium sp. InxBP2 TaxID=2870329 RepID=UPI00249E2F9E|nr:hypothetical protein [Agrobacterium sp. InxBP2]MCW8279885.1 hypothetical protein [Agrobacterium sp. InxBP2]